MRHWCPAELVPYGWGHYSEGPSPGVTGMVKSNQVQPAPVLQSELTEENKSQQSYGDNESEHNDNHEKDLTDEPCIVTVEHTENDNVESVEASLDSAMMMTLCESPHRYLATLDDDLSLDLPSVPM